MQLPRGRVTAPLLCGLLVPISLSACSTTTSSSAHTATSLGSTTTVPAHGATAGASACSLVSSAKVRAITGTTVSSPTHTNRGMTTTCTYKASDPAQSVIIEFEGGATPTSFANGQQAFELHYGPTSPVSGLGSQAYVGTITTGHIETYTVVTLVGASQVVAVGSGSLAHIEELAEDVLSALYANSSRGEPSTTAAAATASSTG